MLNRLNNLLYVRNLIHSTIKCYTSNPERIVTLPKKIAPTFQNNFERNQDEQYKQYFQKGDPDTFGSLTASVINEPYDDGDQREEKYLQNPVPETKKLSTKQYADMIKTYIRKRQIKEAIDVLQIRMIQTDRVKPENYIYNLVLGALGRVGYTKMAFKLFNDMKRRGLEPTGGTYTALFNACANSPWVEDGLSRAIKLRELMIEQQVMANDTNYNAMIKAFGRCNDIPIAFSLVDEMIDKKIPVRVDTLNFLLQSCISDKTVGFRHALLVWRKYHQKHLKPDIFSFNLMLKCIKDCSIGDVETTTNLLNSPEFHVRNNLLSGDNTDSKLAITTSWPNLMAARPTLGSMIKLDEVTKAEDRLLLVGGCSEFLDTMKYFGVTPDIKTFTLLLDSIPGTLSAEKALLSAMKKDKVKIDVDFLNMLIKKRSLRFDYDSAREVLEMFNLSKLRPNIMTYGILALGCETKEQANDLIQEMSDAGYRINIEILGAMLKQACVKLNFVYVLEILELLKKEQIKPNKIFIQHLEDLYKKAKHESKEKTGKFFTTGFRLFRMRYKTWLSEVEIDPKEDTHPWQQFREPTETNVNRYQDPAIYFKHRKRSLFKQKTGTLPVTIKSKTL